MYLYHSSRGNPAGFGWANTLHLTDNLRDTLFFQKYTMVMETRKNPPSEYSESLITIYTFSVDERYIMKYRSGQNYDGGTERGKLEMMVQLVNRPMRYSYSPLSIPIAYCAPVDWIGAPVWYMPVLLQLIKHDKESVKNYRKLHGGLAPVDDFYVVEKRGVFTDWRDDFEQARVDNMEKRELVRNDSLPTIW